MAHEKNGNYLTAVRDGDDSWEASLNTLINVDPLFLAAPHRGQVAVVYCLLKLLL